MRSLFLTAATLAAAVVVTPAEAARAPKPGPVVVEVYTAQGCSACTPAGDLVGELADRDGVLPLTFGVDYWDYLGWKDGNARPEFVQRQRAFAKSLALRGVYTPQAVIDGAAQAPIAQTQRIDRLVKAAAKARSAAPTVRFRRSTVSVGAGRAPRGGAEVWMVRFEPKEQSVEVERGENRGKTVTDRNVVRRLIKLGTWYGKARTFALPATPDEGLSTAVLVEAPKGGRIIASGVRE